MMAATPEEKFNAAVKVIRHLPKAGAFQPSYDLMLKFYAYFKQATEGPCQSPKPGIWNLVSRKKWDAWSALGQMEKETAMLLYVEELKNVSKHVRETLYPPEVSQHIGSPFTLHHISQALRRKVTDKIPQTEQVAEFIDTMVTFYKLINEELSDDSQPASNGSLECNGDVVMDQSASMGKMMRLNNNDSEKRSVESEELPESGTSATDITDREEDNRKDVDEEEERVEDSQRLDSGSDTDEFCDTSDHLVRLPTEVPGVQAAVSRNTSTPVDLKRETRVRFAADVADNTSSIRGGGGTYPSTDPSNSSSQQMLSDRLGLGTATGLSFLPHGTEFPPHHMSDSLHVNNSFSSLTALGDDQAADNDGGEADDQSTLHVADSTSLTSADHFDLVTSRGEDGSSRGAAGMWQSGGDAGSRGAAGGGRGSRLQAGGSTRHGGLAQGSGSGGRRRQDDSGWSGSSVNEQILLTLVRLQQDMNDISKRLAAVEVGITLQREEQAKKAKSKSKWWPFPAMSKTTMFLVFVWPVVVPFLINLLCHRRRRIPR